MNITKHIICISLFLTANNLISSSSSSDESGFDIWAAIQPTRQAMLDDYNYEVCIKAQKLDDSKNLTDFLANSYSEEKKMELELSIKQVLRDGYFNYKIGKTPNNPPVKKINKTLPNPRRQKAQHRKCERSRRKNTSSSSSID